MAHMTFSHQKERSGRVESERCSGYKETTVKFVPNTAIIRDEAESENHLSRRLLSAAAPTLSRSGMPLFAARHPPQERCNLHDEVGKVPTYRPRSLPQSIRGSAQPPPASSMWLALICQSAIRPPNCTRSVQSTIFHACFTILDWNPGGLGKFLSAGDFSSRSSASYVACA